MYRILIVEDDMGIAQAIKKQLNMWDLDARCMEEYQEKDTVCPYCGWTKEGSDTPEGVMESGNILKGRYIVGSVRRQEELAILYIGWDALFSRKVLIMEYFPENFEKA